MHVNQITYIEDRRTFESSVRKPNCIKWSEILEGSTEKKSIHWWTC